MKKQLLATVSGIVLMGAAHGADMAPAYKAAAPVLAPTWAGFYLGVQGGAVRHEASFNNTDGFFNSPTTYNTSKTGGLAGGFLLALKTADKQRRQPGNDRGGSRGFVAQDHR